MGKLPDGLSISVLPDVLVRVLWRYEDSNILGKRGLLMRGKFEVRVKDGHRYRLRINDGNQVSGGGHSVYINGRQLVEAKPATVAVRWTSQGAYITKEFLDDLGVVITILPYISSFQRQVQGQAFLKDSPR